MPSVARRSPSLPFCLSASEFVEEIAAVPVLASALKPKRGPDAGWMAQFGVMGKRSVRGGLAMFAIALLAVCQTSGAQVTNPTPINLGSSPVGTAQTQTTVTFTTVAGTSLATTPLVLMQGAPNLDYTLGTGSTCTGTVSTTSCVVNVVFTPKAPGQRLGAVQLMDSTGTTVLGTALLSGTGTGAAVVFPGNTTSITLGSGFSFPWGVTVDGAGNVYVLDSSGLLKEILAVGGSIPASPTIRTVAGGFSPNAGGGVAIDGAGNIYVADNSNNRVIEIVAVGGSFPSFPTIVTLAPGNFNSPFNVAVDCAGNVYVADTSTFLKELVAVGGSVPSNASITALGSGFINPHGVAVDGAGNVYVADTGNGAVKEIVAVGGSVPSNPAIKSLGSNFPDPHGVAVDGAGNVYVADTGNSAVKEIVAVGGSIPASPTILILGGFFQAPTGVAVDGAGNVYVAERNTSLIKEIPVSLPPSLSFVSTHVGSTSTDSPRSLLLQNIGTGNLTFPIPTAGTNPFLSTNYTLGGSSTCPQLTTTTSAAGTLAPGTCTAVISFAPVIPGTAAGALTFFDDSNNVATASQTVTLNGTVTAAAGTTAQTITFPQPATPAQVGATATLTASSTSGLAIIYSVVSGPATINGSIVTYTGAGGVVLEADQYGNATYAAAPAVQSSVLVQFPVGVGITSSTQVATVTIQTAGTLGAIYVLTTGQPNLDYSFVSGGTCATGTTYTVGNSCTVNYTFTPRAPGQRRGAVQLVGSGGTVVLGTTLVTGTGAGAAVVFPGNTTTVTLGSVFNQLGGLAVDAAGNVYVANTNSNTVKELVAVGGSIPVNPTILTLGSGFNQPHDVAVDGAGNVYVTDSGNNAVKELVAIGGSIPASPTILTLGSGISQPEGVAVDGVGNVYVADYFGHSVRELVAVGGSIPASPTILTLGSGFFSPRRVAVDGTGNVYVADPANNTGSNAAVKEMVAVGGVIPASPTILTLGSGFAFPYDVALDAAGNVYVADVGTNLVKEMVAVGGVIPASPTILTLGSGFSGPTGVAVDGAGSVYVSDTGNNLVKEIPVSLPPSLNFATTAVGSTSTDSPKTLLLQNIGNANLTFPVPATGTDPSIAAGFTLNSSAPTACPQVVAGGTAGSLTPGTCTSVISFTPVAAGSVSGSLIFTDNSLGNAAAVQTVALSGTGIKPTPIFGNMSFSPAATEPQGTSQIITISDTLTYGGVQPTGAVTFTLNGVGYTATCANTGSPETCTFAVPAATIAALAPSAYTVSATLATDTVYTAATGTSGTFTITALSSYVAPTTAVGASSATQTGYVTITIAGTTNATLGTAIQVTLQGIAGLDYAYVTGGTCATNTAYTVGQVCSVNYTFSPKAPSMRLGAIVLGNAAGTGILGTTYLSGVGTGALVGFSPGTITTVAGNGTGGYSGDNGSATAAALYFPRGMVVDGAGNVYILDQANSCIRKLSASTGLITTVAGNGTPGYTGDNGAAVSAELNSPAGMAVDGAGNLYIADVNNHRIRKVSAATGIITTVAGNGTAGYTGDNGAGTSAELQNPNGVAMDGAGNLYIADQSNDRIRKVSVSTGVITTFAGNGTFGYAGDNAAATSAALRHPSAVALDSAGNLYISDTFSHRIREVSASTGVITTVAGNGTGVYAGDNGAATSASLQYPYGLAVDGAGNLYIADSSNQRIRKVSASTGVITTVAGNGTATYAGDNGAATSAALQVPLGVAVDGAGNFYIGDQFNNRIRKVTATAAPVSFSSTNDGSISAAQSVAMTNNGNTTLAASSSGLLVSSNYAQVAGGGTPADCTTTFSLVAGASCNISVAFKPVGASGATAGTATLTDNNVITTGLATGNSTSPSQTINLSGTAVLLVPTFGTMSFSPVATEPQGTSQIITISDTLTYGGVQPTGAVTFTLNGVGYTATCTTAGSPETCSYAVPAATIAALGLNAYVVSAAVATDATYIAATGTSGTFTITVLSSYTAPTTAVGASSATQTAYVNITTAGTTNATLGTGIQVTLQGLAGLDYAYVTGGTCATNTAYTVGQVCSVNYTFSPKAPGTRMGAIVLTDATGSGMLGTTYLSGTGTGALVGFSPGMITTVAGNGIAAFGGDGGLGTAAALSSPAGMAVDGAGNFYIADVNNHRIRKVSAATGIITTVAGNGTAGYTGDNGAAVSAELNSPSGMAVDGAGNLYIADQNNNLIRKVSASSGLITTVAGNGTGAYSGDNGPATNAGLQIPTGITVDGAGNLYIADRYNQRLRKVSASTGVITTVAGNGTGGYAGDNAAATSAELLYPSGVAVDGAGNLYIAEPLNQRIRKVSASTGVITTVAGNGTGGYSGDNGGATSANLNYPTSVAVDSAGNLYITDESNQRIRKVSASTGIITTIAGNGAAAYGGDNGSSTTAPLQFPYGLAVDGAGNVYIADDLNNRIRKVTANAATVSFGSTNDGSISAAQSVTVTNNGNTTLTASSSGLLVSSNYAQVTGGGTPADCTTTFSLVAGASCNISVAFKPVGASGATAGTAILTDNNVVTTGLATGNSTSPSQTINLSGTAVLLVPTFGTMSFSPAATEPHGKSQIITISDTLTYASVQPTGLVTFTLNGVGYTATCTTTGSPETCSYAVPAATIAALGVNTYTVTVAYTADSTYTAATGSSGTFSITAATLGSFSLGGFASPAVLTEQGSVTISALDTIGSVLTSFVGTVTLTSSDANATLPAPYTYVAGDNGVHTFNVTLNTLGTQSITATSGSATGAQAAIVVGDAIWLLHADGTLTKFTNAGTSAGSGTGSGTGTHGSASFDASGNIWTVGSGSNTLNESNKMGTNLAGTGFTGGGLNAPTALQVDGSGMVWVVNGNASVSVFKNNGTAFTPSTGYTGGGMSAPTGLTVDSSGNIWVSNGGNNSVTEFIGGGSPTSQLATGVTNGTTGARP